ncbi:hypothetical protein CICLE_v10006379mg [Citrus x clementina]|uniref:Uncharacterized protein n=1 Tax=Citrus clementina TaxID=85681 RepID=V4RII1_CITCL|nr:hypothetical protein CICLE_v10006379mg [Citrus x clementina]
MSSISRQKEPSLKQKADEPTQKIRIQSVDLEKHENSIIAPCSRPFSKKSDQMERTFESFQEAPGNPCLFL